MPPAFDLLAEPPSGVFHYGQSSWGPTPLGTQFAGLWKNSRINETALRDNFTSTVDAKKKKKDLWFIYEKQLGTSSYTVKSGVDVLGGVNNTSPQCCKPLSPKPIANSAPTKAYCSFMETNWALNKEVGRVSCSTQEWLELGLGFHEGVLWN